MPDDSLERLRQLRNTAERILNYAGNDLSAFLNDDGLTFLRTPDSLRLPGDVNVTTTCSCLMALAATDQAAVVYKNRSEAPTEAFRELVKAPWMSSGLTENNAFTTVLVIRTFGFLQQHGLLSSAMGEQPNLKEWEVGLGVDLGDVDSLVTKLNAHETPVMDLIWRSLSDKALKKIEDWHSAERDESAKKRLRRLLTLEIQRVIEGSWIYTKGRFPKISAELEPRTKARERMYLRADLNRSLIVQNETIFKLRPKTLHQIAQEISADIDNFIINEYPPAATILYWFVDGVTRAKIGLDPNSWRLLSTWAADEFRRQRSLLLADHEAMMDPVAMAMAACLCLCLKTKSSKLGAEESELQKLPTNIELEHSIKELFGKQSNGIWPKYFPLFHYQEAGSNFCFTFELLEALLVEFGNAESPLWEDVNFIRGLSESVGWCEKNLLRSDGEYVGWNSGGSLESLQQSQPESWATAVVYMFLSELVTRLSERIQQQILQRYAKTILPKKDPGPKSGSMATALDRFMDIDVLILDEHKSLRDIVRTEFIEPNLGRTEQTLRRKKAELPLSALLFGPPGTSKTELVKSIASDLQWPLVIIDPSEFLKGTLANIYARADEIFEDLMDLSAAVIFFDEMDALTQRRDTKTHLDTATQFLTTSMLPKLADLHDQGRAMFFVATNFQKNFDPAIKRAGRFDFLLCMGPPLLTEKLSKLFLVFGLRDANAQTITASKCLERFFTAQAQLANDVSLYTFGEFKSFIRSIGSRSTIGNELEKLDLSGFAEKVNSYTPNVTLRARDLGYKGGLSMDALDKIPEKKLKKYAESEIARYVADRKDSRKQY